MRKWTGPLRYFNASYPGIFNGAGKWSPQPVPNVFAFMNGRTVLPSIQLQWASQFYKTYYNDGLEVPDGANPPVYPKY